MARSWSIRSSPISGRVQKALEERELPVTTAELQRIATSTVELTDEEMEPLMTLIEKIEDDDDVQAVYHNIA